MKSLTLMIFKMKQEPDFNKLDILKMVMDVGNQLVTTMGCWWPTWSLFMKNLILLILQAFKTFFFVSYWPIIGSLSELKVYFRKHYIAYNQIINVIQTFQNRSAYFWIFLNGFEWEWLRFWIGFGISFRIGFFLLA